MKSKCIPGINIQWPISELIVNGKKTIETRKYPLPEKYIGQTLALIETPGPKGKFRARITALIKFGPSFQYQNKKEFYKDTKRHCVSQKSEWEWKSESKKIWLAC